LADPKLGRLRGDFHWLALLKVRIGCGERLDQSITVDVDRAVRILAGF
jgi:hypothetical protein